MTENSRSAGTGIMQGVRQLGPSEVLASAPGGSDSMVSETLVPPPTLDMLGRKSQLGVHDEQPATDSAPTRAPTRTTRGVIVALFPDQSPRPSPPCGPYSPPADLASPPADPVSPPEDFTSPPARTH